MADYFKLSASGIYASDSSLATVKSRTNLADYNNAALTRYIQMQVLIPAAPGVQFVQLAPYVTSIDTLLLKNTGTVAFNLAWSQFVSEVTTTATFVSATKSVTAATGIFTTLAGAAPGRWFSVTGSTSNDTSGTSFKGISAVTLPTATSMVTFATSGFVDEGPTPGVTFRFFSRNMCTVQPGQFFSVPAVFVSEGLVMESYGAATQAELMLAGT